MSNPFIPFPQQDVYKINSESIKSCDLSHSLIFHGAWRLSCVADNTVISLHSTIYKQFLKSARIFLPINSIQQIGQPVALWNNVTFEHDPHRFPLNIGSHARSLTRVRGKERERSPIRFSIAPDDTYLTASVCRALTFYCRAECPNRSPALTSSFVRPRAKLPPDWLLPVVRKADGPRPITLGSRPTPDLHSISRCA